MKHFSLTPKYIASETLPGHFVSFIVNRCFRLTTFLFSLVQPMALLW